MDIKLTTDIKELLIEDGSISIPSFGGFTSTYKPAVVDSINGQLAPPSFHIAFDANLQMNDGRLVEHIRQKYRLSSTAAFEYIETFANEARNNFDKGEIVVLPEIGRLYRDFAQKIQFLPDSTNFNTASFGLPTIQFTPILRNKVDAITRSASADTVPEPQASMPPIVPTLPRQADTPTPSVNREADANSTVSPSFFQKNTAETPQSGAFSVQAPVLVETLAGRNSAEFPVSMESVKPPTMQESVRMNDFLEKVRDNWRTWLPAAAAVVVLAFLIWQLKSTSNVKNTEGSKKTRLAEPNVNTSPLQNIDSAPKENSAPPVNGEIGTQMPKNQQGITTITSPEVLAESRKSDNKTTRQPNLNTAEAPNKGSKKATILIGGFGDKRNIKKLKAWISAKGYGIYERPSGGLTLIGCEVKYETRADLQKVLTEMRNKFGEEIELIKK